MVKISILEDIQQDLKDIEGLINCQNENSTEVLKNQIRAVMMNLQEHLEELNTDYISVLNSRQNNK